MKINAFISLLVLGFLTLIFSAKVANGQIRLNHFNLSFTRVTADDLETGYVEAHYSASDLTVQINNNSTSLWNLYITCEQPFFSPEIMNKPCYHLLWKLSSEPESKYRPVNLQQCPIATGRSSMNINLDFRLKLSWSDPPSEYRIQILFILESNRSKIIPSQKKIKNLNAAK